MMTTPSTSADRTTRVKEAELDHAFAESLLASREMQNWLLKGGRFARFAASAKLLHAEQEAARKAKHWWKHWWVELPDGSQSETDIFLVFEACGNRFALHIENKPSDGKLTIRQAVDYRRRAAFISNRIGWLDHSDFETILMAPSKLLQSHSDCVAQFDRTLEYEAVREFVSLFANSAATVPDK